jgi:hypothetical protein
MQSKKKIEFDQLLKKRRRHNRRNESNYVHTHRIYKIQKAKTLV